MKVEKIVIFCLITAFLIGGGVWLGVVLTQNNSQPVMAINFVLDNKNEKNFDILLLVNRKNKIISSSIYQNDFDKKFENSKFIAGKSTKDFAQTIAEYFSKTQNENVDILIELYGTNHNKTFDAKTKISSKIVEIFKKNGKKCTINSNFFTNKTNLSQKYKGLSQKFLANENDFFDKTESEILYTFYESCKKKT